MEAVEWVAQTSEHNSAIRTVFQEVNQITVAQKYQLMNSKTEGAQIE
jgi:hypothetical protein